KLFGATVEEVREAHLEPRLYRTVGPVGFVKGIRHAQSRLEFGIRVVGECCDDFTGCRVNASVRQGLSPHKRRQRATKEGSARHPSWMEYLQHLLPSSFRAFLA